MSGKKEYTIFQEEGFQTLLVYYNYIVTCLNYLISIEKNICVAMQSDNVV